MIRILKRPPNWVANTETHCVRIEKRRSGSQLMVVLDTDLMTLLGWSDGQLGLRLRTRLAQVPSSEISTTVITFEEYTRGWLSLLAQSKKIKEQIQTYKRLNRQLFLFCSTLVLDFDERAAVEY